MTAGKPTHAELRDRLTSEQYRVTQEKAPSGRSPGSTST